MIEFNDMKTTVPGAYMILNVTTNGRYVGSAARRIANRFSEHRSHLRKGNHQNSHLQNAWNKYGEAAFVFIALENTDKEGAIDAEDRWFRLFKSQGLPLYNKRENVRSQLGYKPTEEAKAKSRAAQLGKKKIMSPEGYASLLEKLKGRDFGPPDERPEAKPYSLISPTGEIVIGRNLTDFARVNGIAISSIAKVVRGTIKSYKGWTAPEARAAYLLEHPLKRTNDHYKTCERCGKQFKIVPSSASIRRFCSMTCRNEHDKETYAGEGNPNYKHGGRVTGVKRIRHRASLP